MKCNGSGGGARAMTARAAQQEIERLAEGPTGRKRQAAIVDVLERLPPDRRAEALRLIDGGSDRHTVSKVLARDLTERGLRARAQRLVDEARGAAPPGAERVVISDIDDTVRPMKDKKAPRDAFPGARALYRALDLGRGGEGTPGDVHFVTARDGFFLGGASALKTTGIEHGSVKHGGLSALFGNRAIEEQKVKAHEELLARNPKSSAVLVGDSVQADARVFKRLLDDHPERIELALIHRVRGFPVPDDIAAHPKVVVFDDYADAARTLHARGLISDTQLHDVIHDR